MVNRTVAALVAVSFLGLQGVPSPALAENQMGYRLLSVSQAQELPRNGGVLGIDVGRAQQITDSGMTFELLRVNGVRRNSPGEQAGFKTGDQIIAVDGQVFPSVAAFAAYVGSLQPGGQISVDSIPAGGGPQDAQRSTVTLGGAAASAPAQQSDPVRPQGMSTATKVAIGIGAAALFGCYKVGCVSRLKNKLGAHPQPGTLQPQQ